MQRSSHRRTLKSEKEAEKEEIIRAVTLPLIIVAILWTVKLIEVSLGAQWHHLGIYPRSLEGIAGIFTSPFIHGDFSHLFSNSAPLLVASTLIMYFYKGVAIKVFLWIFFLNGISVWMLARESYHIGISGLVYGMVTFLFFSGLIRKDQRLMAISLLMVFLYGGMVWGVLPIQEGVSWESHLLGALAGIFAAFIYRDHGPQRKKYDWEDEEDDEDTNRQFSWDKIYQEYEDGRY